MLAAGASEAAKAEARRQKRRDPARRPGAELLPACCCSAWCLVLALVLNVAVSSAPQAQKLWRRPGGEAEARLSEARQKDRSSARRPS
jgi:hypothetical protein